ncbi:ATP-binding protein [Tepidibacillus sp. LV47]|uniref:ATP-binding protein n=1 Tax=Tepidibacillus sp. LV47 TaxID=3398228 RepID=UPI003AAFD46D
MIDDDILTFLRKSIAKNEAEAQKILAEERQKRLDKLLSDSGLGKKFRKRTFSTFKVTKDNHVALTAAQNFINEFPNGKGLLLTGPVGTGKTHIAAAIANELIKQFYTVIFRNVVDIISLIVSTYHQSEKTILEIINTFTKADLLIIDDLGKEKMTEHTSTVLYQIINKIYEDEKPIIITTNFTSEKLEQNLGERGNAIVSRLTEMCRPIVLSGRDWRLKNASS